MKTWLRNSLLFWLTLWGLLISGPSQAFWTSANSDTVALSALPLEAQQTLALIKTGGPFPYARDGITFGNYEKRLPLKPRGYYSEYTVKTPGRKDRGARRIIAGEGREYYYTDDHYQSFRRIRE